MGAMPVHYAIDGAHRRVILTISGTYVIDEMERCYAALFSDPGFVAGLDLLIDGRASRGSPTTVDLRARARRAGDLKGRFSGRIALVAGTMHIEYALGRMYAVFAEEYGVSAQVFTTIPEAERWLDGDAPLPSPSGAARP